MRILSKVCHDWVGTRLRSGVRDFTAYSYRGSLAALCRFLEDKAASEMSLDDLVAYRRHVLETVSMGTAKVRWDLAVAVVRWAQDQGEIPNWRIPREIVRMRGAPPFRRVWTPCEIARMLNGACTLMRSLILLGINLGYGNRDCARLAPRNVSGHVVDAIRHKTGTERRGWLWPETLRALEACPPPFTNRRGRPIVVDGQDYVRPRLKALLKSCGIEPNGRGFYSFRRAYRTAVDSHWDRPAIDLTMGHTTPGMGARYVAWIDEDRLQAVSFHARSKLLGRSEGNVVPAAAWGR
jgi:integrase